MSICLRRAAVAWACAWLALAGAQAADLIVVPPGTHRTLMVDAAPGAAFLLLEGRFVSSAEGRPLTAIRLIFNDRVVDGGRLHGSAEFLPATFVKSSVPPAPRYSPSGRCFAFPVDSDYVVGNSPPSSPGDSISLTYGCPHMLQVGVRDLLRPGANELVIVNAAQTPFEIRRLALAARPEEVRDPILPTPSWPLFCYSASARALYRSALADDDLPHVWRAHILAALGTGEVLRPGGSRKQAAADWCAALRAGVAFDLAGEAAYRLAAERLRSGRWPDASIERTVREQAAADDPWAELARAVLHLVDGKEASSPRPIIRPAFSAEPQRLDGRLDEAFWRSARVYPIATPMGEGLIPAYAADVRFAVLRKGLAVGFTGQLPESVAWRTGLERDSPVWEDNCVELFLAPDTDLGVYYELNATALGAQFDARNIWWWQTHSSWDGAWQMASRMEGARFSIEYFIPWSDLGSRSRPKAGHVFVVGVSHYAVEVKDGQRLGRFLTLTRHRAYDCHRLMDDALMVMP